MFFAIFDDFYGGLDRPSLTREEKKEHNWENNLGQNYFREEKIPKKYHKHT